MSYTSSIVLFNATPLTLQSGPEMSSDLATVCNLDTPDDGLGGVFAWSPWSDATDDAMNVFQPSSVTGRGRWVRVSGQPAGDGTFTIPIAFEAGITVTTTEEDGNGVTSTGDGDGAGGVFVSEGASTTIPAYAAASGVFARSDTESSTAVYGESTATNGHGGEFDGTGTGYGVIGYAYGSGTAVYGQNAGTGYGVAAQADTTSPVSAALRIAPQNAAPSSPFEGDVYSDSVTHALCHYDGSNWVETGARYATASIASADIIGTSAGQLGHASGVVIVPSPGAGKAIEFLSGVVILDYAGAAYTDGGNVTFNYAGGGAAVSTAVSNANSVTGSADKVALVLATAPTNNQLTAATGLNLVSASAPTQPGGATGVLRVKVSYRVHATGL